MDRFIAYSSIGEAKNVNKNKVSKIIELYHSIEKGLAMPNLRLGFGQDNIRLLAKMCFDYLATFEKNEQVSHGINVLNNYFKFHREQNYLFEKDIQEIECKIHNQKDSSDTNIFYDKSISSFEYWKNVDGCFDSFSTSRKSVRNYSDKSISLDIIKEAIKLSTNAPSACNRQSARVYLYTDKLRIQKILSIQGGSRGFGDLTDKLIVITSDLGVWGFLSEHNQSFIDGGIYAMNMLYSLHYNKIAACILNCSLNPQKDKELRSLCNIESSESFIAMITCGNIPDSIKVPISKRYDYNNITKIIEN